MQEQGIVVSVGDNLFFNGYVYSNKTCFSERVYIPNLSIVHVLEKRNFVEFLTGSKLGKDSYMSITMDTSEEFYKHMHQIDFLPLNLYEKCPLNDIEQHQHILRCFERNDQAPIRIDEKYPRHQFKIMLTDGRIGWTHRYPENSLDNHFRKVNKI